MFFLEEENDGISEGGELFVEVAETAMVEPIGLSVDEIDGQDFRLGSAKR